MTAGNNLVEAIQTLGFLLKMIEEKPELDKERELVRAAFEAANAALDKVLASRLAITEQAKQL